MTVKFVFAVLISLLAVNAFADDAPWDHQNLRGGDGTVISLDYQFHYINSFDGFFEEVANPLWINITSPTLQPSDHIRAVISNFCYAQGTGPASAGMTYQQTADLNMGAPGRFTAQLQSEQTRWTANGVFKNCFLRVSVVRNGLWLTDPVSQSHDFVADLHVGSQQ